MSPVRPTVQVVGRSFDPDPDLLQDGQRPVEWPLDRDPFTLETLVPGLFATGDLRSGSAKRVVSAVGEGATAVELVHRRMEELAAAG